MSKKTTKSKKSRPLLKPNQQIPISLIRKSSSIVLSSYLEHAREYPIYGCWVMAGWQESGITPVVVAREQEPGRVMFGVYLVDLYCLGIKNAFTQTDYSLNRFERELPNFCAGAPEQCSVELAHKIIYSALEYAEKLGFQSHPDFKRQMADLMLDPPDAYPRVNHVTYGKMANSSMSPGPTTTNVRLRLCSIP